MKEWCDVCGGNLIRGLGHALGCPEKVRDPQILIDALEMISKSSCFSNECDFGNDLNPAQQAREALAKWKER